MYLPCAGIKVVVSDRVVQLLEGEVVVQIRVLLVHSGYNLAVNLRFDGGYYYDLFTIRAGLHYEQSFFNGQIEIFVFVIYR